MLPHQTPWAAVVPPNFTGSYKGKLGGPSPTRAQQPQIIGPSDPSAFPPNEATPVQPASMFTGSTGGRPQTACGTGLGGSRPPASITNQRQAPVTNYTFKLPTPSNLGTGERPPPRTPLGPLAKRLRLLSETSRAAPSPGQRPMRSKGQGGGPSAALRSLALDNRSAQDQGPPAGRDSRAQKERRKYGLKKARKAPQFSKALIFSSHGPKAQHSIPPLVYPGKRQGESANGKKVG